MIKSILFVLIILGIYFMTLSDKEPEQYDTSTYVSSEASNKKSLDTLTETYKTRVEAQNIANTINPSNSYLGSRLDSKTGASDAVKVGNERMGAQDKAIETLMR